MRTQLCSFICTVGHKGRSLLGEMEAHWLAESEDLLTRFFTEFTDLLCGSVMVSIVAVAS